MFGSKHVCFRITAKPAGGQPICDSSSSSSFVNGYGPKDATWRASTFEVINGADNTVETTVIRGADTTVEVAASTAVQGAASGTNFGTNGADTNGGGLGAKTTVECAACVCVGASPTNHTAAALRAVQEQSAL